jgi:energy-coupling factor transporter transmembrane protein EcfT
VIDVARIDHWAASGSGPLHKASPISKAVFLLFVISAAVLSRNPYPLMTGYGVLLAVAAAAGLPWVKAAVFSWYAAVFALLYGISLGGGTWIVSLFIVKAITPALAMLMLIVSTPYPRIFSLLSSILPEALVAGLFMTYRTFFILLDMMDNFGAAIRLRGGFSRGNLFKNSTNISRGIGMLLIRSVERASRLYGVMVVRGYTGSMADTGTIRPRREDWLPLGTGAVVFLISLVWK